MGLFYAKAARKVLCEIYKNEMYGKKYVWFFIGWYEDNWFNSEKHLKEENIGCSRQEMEKAAEGHFTTEALQWNSDRYSPTVSGHVSVVMHGVWKLQKKSHSTLWAKRATFTKVHKNAKNLASLGKLEAGGRTALPDRSMLIGQKLIENAKY